MAAKLLDGKTLAIKMKEGIKKDLALLKRVPSLVSIQLGDDPASVSYINSQKKAAENLGINYRLEKLDSGASQDELIKVIDRLNNDASVNGIIAQMPLPKKVDARAIAARIDPSKDIEAMNPKNMGELVFGGARILPCTAGACMELLNSIEGLDLYGKQAVIIGHSEIVGKPLALLLLNKFATTTVCHIATGERGCLPEFVQKAEILIVAVGKPGIVKGEWIKQGAVVIDVGINRVNGKLVGDVEFDQAKERASYITPVPGGVGPLTTAMLMKNLLEAAKMQEKES
ncbi:MAG: bifunctional 5,10-methylenetetrahydrofolate dehydrogenase/5,10-methenyltetrahydrofolate cyclohydrolase [Candidatus Omnitrophica bacterium]|nr:bifunctional 5,10-methylenetetrahydrofolate dehydrogenase/5,10-methenyltetrahydrofolate cyclohydrolase [Candidatus Omnitrophota bacterium]